MRRLKTTSFFKHKRAVSYAVSAIIITATTVSLVLAAFFYSYQVLERQRGLSEFEITKKSILAFNDALENAAWKPGESRFTRFTVEYGHLQLRPNLNSVGINATVDGSSEILSNTTFPGDTGGIKYWLSTDYVTFEPGYESYILGNSDPVVAGSTESYGRAVIQQQTGWVTITLDYRVRVMRTSVINVDGVNINYVDIWVIKPIMLVLHDWDYVHDFDLKAKSLNVKTVSHSFPVNSDSIIVSVRIGDSPVSEVPVALENPDEVVFNVIVAEVQVNV